MLLRDESGRKDSTALLMPDESHIKFVLKEASER
jgi:hypothetical protein